MARSLAVIIMFYLLLTMSTYVSASGAGQYVQSESSMYAGLRLGYVNPLDDYKEANLSPTEWESDGGLNCAIAAGWHWNTFRAEGEISYRKMEMKSRYSKKNATRTGLEGDQDHLAFMINGYWQPVTDWTFAPYAGAGFGFTRISWNDVRAESATNGITDKDNVFTYQLIAGASYPLTPGLFLEAEYRFIAPRDPSFTDASGLEGRLEDQELHLISLALRYYFPGFSK